MPRPRKPVRQHKLQGTYLRARHSTRREVEAAGDLLDNPPPKHLTPAERTIWRETCAVAPGQLWRPADQFVLEAFTAAVAAHRAARAELATVTVLTDRDSHIHPLMGEIRRQASLIRELGACLGLTPQSRLQLLDGHDPGEDLRTPLGLLRVISGGATAELRQRLKR